MQNLAKRQWGHQLSVKEAKDILVDWCIRAREKNALRKRPPQIFYAYVLDDTPPFQFMNNVASVFKYSQKDVPYIDMARDSLLRCLSIALKVHYFMFEDDAVSHEPYFFVLPSLADPSTTTFGIVYKIEKQDKSIVVCDKKLDALFEHKKVFFEFPAVLTEDSFKWYSLKEWAKVKGHSNFEKMIDKPWVGKKMGQAAQEAKTIEELELNATVLDIPYEFKDDLKPLGIEWNKNLKKWYLIKGFDVVSVLEYLDYLKSSKPMQK